MAQYDGSIRIGTEITTKQAEKELKRLESSIKQSASEISRLQTEMENVKTPTKQYESLQHAINTSKTELEAFVEEQKSLSDKGIGKGIDKEYLAASEAVKRLKSELQQAIEIGDKDAYLGIEDRLNKAKSVLQEMMSKNPRPLGDIAYYYSIDKKIEDLKNNISLTESEMKKLEESGKAFTLGEGAEEKAARIKELTEQMAADTQRQSELQSALAAEEERLAQIKKNAVVSEQMIVEAAERRKQLLQEIADLEAAGVTHGYQDYDSRIQELAEIERKLKDYSSRTKEIAASYKRFGQSMRQLASRTVGSLSSMGDAIKRVDSGLKMLGERVRNTFSRVNRSAQKTGGIFTTMASRFKGLALSLLIFNQISRAFNTMTHAIRDGFKNLYEDNEKFKNSVDNLNASVLTLKNAFAAAFRPIVDMAVPYIQRLVEWLTYAVNLAGQFFAALTGRKAYTRAIKQTAKASEDAAEAAEDEAGAMKKQLSPLDKLNNLTSESNKEKDKGKDDKEIGTGIMFEEVPIDSNILEMADKVKDILSKLFAPLKEAWNREGKFVMDSWKYVLDEVWKLIKDIGRDFLTVWQQEATVKIFENLLHIIGDIGLVVGNLARNFREAWNENEVGLHILENIRDIIGIIVEHIRNAADATVEWSDKLDFYPLLDAFNRFLEALEPAVDALSGVLEDFYTKVMLPLGTWVLEKGLPELLQVFIDFNNKVDWESLRTNLSEFWEHLEPFAETVGEGLIIFIERVSNALANFINSQEFKDFLVMIENWMDSVSPEDVADALTKIAAGLLLLKFASASFGVLSVVTKILPLLFSGITKVSGAFSLLASPVGIVVALVAALAAGFIYAYNTSDEFRQKLNELKEKFIEFWEQNLKPMLEEWGEKFKALWEEHLKPSLESLMTALELLWNEVLQPLIGWIIDNILPVLLPIADSMMTKIIDTVSLISDAIGTISDIISGLIELVVKLINGDWSGAWNTAKSIVKNAAGWIGGYIEGIINKIVKLGEKLSSLFEKGVTMPGAPAGASMSRSSRMSTPTPYAVHPAIAKLSNIEIPQLATGAVLPANREFLALVGDQKHGTNVEAPLDTIKQALREEAISLGLIGKNETPEINLNLTVECAGYQLLNIMQKLDSEYFKQTGRHALA